MEKKMRVILSEDDENLGSLLREYLIAKGYDTDLYPDGEAAYKGFQKNQYDLCIFDVMMPKKDGFTLAKEIRMLNSDIPVIFLTAKSMKEDVIEGFKIGADDYMTKPFSMEELLFRIEAILRRSGGEGDNSQSVFKLGKFIFDARKQTLSDANENTKLTTKEADMLKLLYVNANKILERNIALKTISVHHNYYNTKSLHVYITNPRKQLQSKKSIEIINVHGNGYNP